MPKSCVLSHFMFSYGPRREKTCLRWFTNNKGADQPVHPHILISAFVICFLESIIRKLATGEISLFYLVSVVEETGLNLALSETRKTGFLATRPISFHPSCRVKQLRQLSSSRTQCHLIW